MTVLVAMEAAAVDSVAKLAAGPATPFTIAVPATRLPVQPAGAVSIHKAMVYRIEPPAVVHGTTRRRGDEWEEREQKA